MKKILTVMFLMMIGGVFVAGCGNSKTIYVNTPGDSGNGGGGSGTATTGAIVFSIDFNSSARVADISRAEASKVMMATAITSTVVNSDYRQRVGVVIVNVRDTGNNIVMSGSFAVVGGVASGTMYGIAPATYTVEVLGVTTNRHIVLYQGQATGVTVSAGQTSNANIYLGLATPNIPFVISGITGTFNTGPTYATTVQTAVLVSGVSTTISTSTIPSTYVGGNVLLTAVVSLMPVSTLISYSITDSVGTVFAYDTNFDILQVIDSIELTGSYIIAHQSTGSITVNIGFTDTDPIVGTDILLSSSGTFTVNNIASYFYVNGTRLTNLGAYTVNVVGDFNAWVPSATGVTISGGALSLNLGAYTVADGNIRFSFVLSNGTSWMSLASLPSNDQTLFVRNNAVNQQSLAFSKTGSLFTIVPIGIVLP